MNKKSKNLSNQNILKAKSTIIGVDESGNEIDKSEMSKFERIMDFLDNYKWHFFIIALVILFVVYAINLFSKKDNNDIQILYTGYEFIEDSKVDSLKTSCGYISKDYNGDDVLNVDFLSFIVDKKVDYEGKYTYDSTMVTRFNTELNTSSSIIFIVENSYYELLKNSGLLQPISEVLEEVPEGAIDEYGVLLSTLDLYLLDGFKELSPDSVICIRRPRKENEIKYISEEQYGYNLDFFKKAIEYKTDVQ